MQGSRLQTCLPIPVKSSVYDSSSEDEQHCTADEEVNSPKPTTESAAIVDKSPSRDLQSPTLAELPFSHGDNVNNEESLLTDAELDEIISKNQSPGKVNEKRMNETKEDSSVIPGRSSALQRSSSLDNRRTAAGSQLPARHLGRSVSSFIRSSSAMLQGKSKTKTSEQISDAAELNRDDTLTALPRMRTVHEGRIFGASDTFHPAEQANNDRGSNAGTQRHTKLSSSIGSIKRFLRARSHSLSRAPQPRFQVENPASLPRRRMSTTTPRSATAKPSQDQSRRLSLPLAFPTARPTADTSNQTHEDRMTAHQELMASALPPPRPPLRSLAPTSSRFTTPSRSTLHNLIISQQSRISDLNLENRVMRDQIGYLRADWTEAEKQLDLERAKVWDAEMNQFRLGVELEKLKTEIGRIKRGSMMLPQVPEFVG